MNKTSLDAWILNKIGYNLNNNLDKNSLRKTLDKYQLRKLKENLSYVKENSLFYKEKLKNISVEEINSFNDFENIPFTTAKHLKDGELRFLCVSQSDISRIVSLNTSGTSGVSKRIYFTQKDQELTVDFFHNGMKCLVQEGDKVLILLPGETLGSVGDLLSKGLKRLNVTSFKYGPIKETKDAAEIIEKEKINCIVGIPIQVLTLKRQQASIFNKYITRILLSTDYVPQTLINELSSDKCRVFTHYGMTEMGLGGGVECEALNGYHMREADLYFEVINPKTGKRVKDGKYGEIVFTTLTRVGMPLIRYRCGDIGRFLNTPCTCGSMLKTMERVSGRIENGIELFKNKFLYMKDLDEALLKRKEILNYEVSIEKHECYNIVINLKVTEEAFEKLENDIYNDLCQILNIGEGVKKGIIKPILKIASKDIYTGNGTFKRIIKDLR